MGSFCDLTQHRFGRLVVIQRTNDYITAGGQKKVQYLCRCDCGKMTTVSAERLRSGKTKSCGCFAKEISLCHIQQVNESGQNIIDLTGKRFGKLLVEHILPVDRRYKNFSRRWHCKCDCGNECDVFGQSLRSGLTKSCGCLNSEVRHQFDDLTGKHFGYWTVIKRVDNVVKPSGQDDPAYLCECVCGVKRTVLAQSLKSNRSMSCGCKRLSNGELLLVNVFNDLEVTFVAQLKFDDLLSPNGMKLSYDFGIYCNDKLVGLVEYQGKQHYEPVEYFGGVVTYERQQAYDDMKRIYVLEHSIPLLEIPYPCNTYDEIFIYVSTFCKKYCGYDG